MSEETQGLSKSLGEVRLAPVTQADLLAYAEASGDQNPIHQDPEVAAQMGLPGVIAHGMWVAGHLASVAQKQSKASGLGSLTRFQSRFRGMVLLGDTLVIRSKWLASTREGRPVLGLEAVNQRGETVTTGQAEYAPVPTTLAGSRDHSSSTVAG